MPAQTLEPIAPKEAFDWYLEDKEQEYSKITLNAHRLRLQHFIRWTDNQDIDNMNEMDGRKVQKYKTWRTREGGLNKVSQRTQMSTLRVFLTWCSGIDGVYEHVADQVQVPSVDKREKKRTKEADPVLIMDALDYLRKYEYASNKHVALELMWHTALRIGGVHALDLADYHPEAAYLNIEHRPDTDTTLKNKHAGNRSVNLSNEMCTLLDDYIETNRYDHTDKHDRQPLLTTRKGRVARTTLRGWTYKATQPCRIGEGCPSGKNPETCKHAEHAHVASCPHNYSPHAIRGGSITYHRSQGWPVEHLSERVNASPQVIKDHYDEPGVAEDLSRRREFMEKL